MKQPLKIVYKYRDWKNPFHKKILQNNEIYLSSPKDFNDPFDCRISSNFSLLTPKEQNDYINDLAISGFYESEKQGYDFYQIIKNLEDRFKDRFEFQRFADSLLFDFQDKSYAIFSCSKRWNSILMWSHYANLHTGFCVGLWVDKMKDCRIFGKLGEVIYESKFPQIKPRLAKKDNQMMINSFLETHTKAKEWVYEKEYRFMSNHFPKELTLADRIKIIPDNFFAEVILGVNISNEDKIEIKKICDHKEIPLFEAVKTDFKFNITRIRI
jgi:hypothetical protein